MKMDKRTLVRFTNCKMLRNHSIITEDLYVRDGKVMDPEKLFFDEQIEADKVIDCKGSIIAPGFIDLQINGGFGIDFSHPENVKENVQFVAKKILSHGVTSFCPTVVTSPKEVYQTVLPQITERDGDENGATVLGIHVEGPFINVEKKGAHPPSCIKPLDKGFTTVQDVYGDLSNVKIVTLAPELENVDVVIEKLSKMGIVVSVGHSAGDLKDGEVAVSKGATLITHLFNAMLPFHHRDPGLVGLLTSSKIPEERTVYYGIISDGIHTHPAALRIAYRTHPNGLVLVTDALSALGLEEGRHRIGQMDVEIRNRMAFVAGTNTLCGSVAPMIECVKLFLKATGCSMEYALEAASLHPAQVMGIDDKKGTLDYGADADLVFLDEHLHLKSTWIAGECVYHT